MKKKIALVKPVAKKNLERSSERFKHFSALKLGKKCNFKYECFGWLHNYLKAKINIFWKKNFFTPQAPSGPLHSKKFQKNIDFSLWGKQCIAVLPKWTFFRIYLIVDRLSGKKYMLHVILPPLVDGYSLVAPRVHEMIFV